jgi:hypothetical protein
MTDKKLKQYQINDLTKKCYADYQQYKDSHFREFGVLYDRLNDLTLQNPPDINQVDLMSTISLKEYEIKADLDSPYWAPEEKYKNHFLSIINNDVKTKVLDAEKKGGSYLNKVQPWKRNPCFFDFPIQYDPFFYDYEINNTVRLKRLDLDNCVLEVQISNYLDQLATNANPTLRFAIDGKDTNFLELSLNDSYYFKNYEHSPLSNTIGIACLFLDNKNIPIYCMRNRKTTATVTEGELHCTSSGVLEWEDLFFDGKNPSAEGIVSAMQREIFSEIGLYPIEYSISCFGLAREFKRAGKPQLFFVCKIDSDFKKFVNTHNLRLHMNREGHELTSKKNIIRKEKFFFQEIKDPINNIALEELKIKKYKFTYEGYANTFFLTQLLNKKEINYRA